MRTFTGIIVGVTATILLHTHGWPFLAWALTRVAPNATSTPRHRTWHAGIETFEETP